MLGDPSVPARVFLSAVVDRYELDDVPDDEQLPRYPDGHPQAGLTRAWVGHGSPGSLAADEVDPFNPLGSLCVAVQRINVQAPTQGGTGPQMTRLTTHSASFHIRLLRRVPALGVDGMPAPNPDDITAASLILARDAARLTDAVHAAAAALPPTLRVGFDNVDTIAPQGMLAGNRAAVLIGPI